MTIELFILFIAALVLSGTVAYAVWCGVRTPLLRQDLFEIRDDLWLKAFAMNGLSDSAYQETRHHINALIRMAGLMNIPVLNEVADRIERPIQPPSQSPNEDLNAALCAAREKAIDRVMSYIFFGHASGYFELLKIILKRSVGEMRQGYQTVACALSSQAVDQLSEVDKTSGRGYYAAN